MLQGTHFDPAPRLPPCAQPPLPFRLLRAFWDHSRVVAGLSPALMPPCEQAFSRQPGRLCPISRCN